MPNHPLAYSGANSFDTIGFDTVGFGSVGMTAGSSGLRLQMNICLEQLLINDLPAELSEQGQQLLAQYYPPNSDDLFSLFYQPVWSFLHWFDDVPECAVTAHAVALFLHLWDDHILDRQLAETEVTLAVRDTLMRAMEQSFIEFSSPLTESLSYREQSDRYSAALKNTTQLATLPEYMARFREQIAIWTLVPHWLVFNQSGQRAADAMVQVIENFCMAWRLVDDIEDIDQDIKQKSKTAVYLAATDKGKQLWQKSEIAQHVTASGQSDSYCELLSVLHAAGTVDELLNQARSYLNDAIGLCGCFGWREIEQELKEARQGL
jgi:hypothetical protein